MILLDFSQTCIANVFQQLKKQELSPDLLKHMILNSIRKINKDFRNEFGKLVICTDSYVYWRKSAFQYYKANRKKDRDESEVDWPMVFETLNAVRDDLKNYFPYKVMNVPNAEADDVIAILTNQYKHQEKILIVTSDKDMIQLLDNNVSIYRPKEEELLVYENSELQ